MATLSIPKNYKDGDPLFESDLDDIRVGFQDFINTTKINDDNIQNDGITASSKLKDNSVTGDKLASAVAGTGLSQDGSGNLQIADNGVTQAKLEDRSVTTDGTDPGAGGVSISTETDSGSFNNTSYSDLSGFSVTLTTTGRPVMVMLIGSAGDLSNGGYLHLDGGSGTNVGSVLFLKLVRNSTDIAALRFGVDLQISSGDQTLNGVVYDTPASSIVFLDTPNAGTHTYKLQKRVNANSAQVSDCRLMAFEI